MIWCTWLLLVNLRMIWCFGFFFLDILDDCDEETQQRCDALASLDDVGRKLGSVPTVTLDVRGLALLCLTGMAMAENKSNQM